MANIDVGSEVIDRSSYLMSGYTRVVNNNPANDTGILDTIELWAVTNLAGCIVGTLYGSGIGWTCRDVETIGAVTAGSKQTFTGKSLNVQTKDIIGTYHTSGQLERDTGGSTLLFKSGNHLSIGEYLAYSSSSGNMSLYATGVTVPDAPTSVAASDDLSDKVTITWTAGTGETDGHRVYRDGADVSGVVAHGTATYDDTPDAGTYAYTVKAINAAGLSAASSADNGTRTSGGGTGFKTIKVSGNWKAVNAKQIKVGGVWKAISSVKTKVGGTWK